MSGNSDSPSETVPTEEKNTDVVMEDAPTDTVTGPEEGEVRN